MDVRRDRHLPSEERLSKRREFLRVQGTGRRLQTPHFVVFYCPPTPDVRRSDPSQPLRLGITVTRKVGNAVVRNRIKRLVRDVFRNHKDWFPPHGEVVFVARPGGDPIQHAALERELEMLCRQRFSRR